MQILHIITRYWPGIGGGENYLKEVSERLAADGHAVTVVTSDADDADLFWNPAARRVLTRQETLNGVRILRFPIRHLPFSPTSYSIWRYLMFWGLAQVPVVPEPALVWLSRFTPWVPDLRRWLAETGEVFDVVGGMAILHEGFVGAGLRAARRWGAPYLLYPLTHLGDQSVPGRDRVSRYYTMRHQRALVRQAAAVVTMTPTEGAFYERDGLSAERVHVVGAGINPDSVQGGDGQRFRSEHHISGPLVAFLSAMAYDKGTVHLVEAVRQLWQAGPAVELALAGTITQPFRGYLNRLPGDVRQRLRVLGPISEAEKRDLLAAADIVAMPSRTDSFGILYLEAWLYRKPVIGAKAWGMSDVIRDGEDGLLVPFGDVPALAEAIRFLIDHPETRAQMGTRGEAKVRLRYTWDHCYSLIREVYSRLTNKGD